MKTTDGINAARGAKFVARIKRFFAALIAVTAAAACLCCNLADVPESDGGAGGALKELAFDSDYLVGFLAYVRQDSADGSQEIILPLGAVCPPAAIPPAEVTLQDGTAVTFPGSDIEPSVLADGFFESNPIMGSYAYRGGYAADGKDYFYTGFKGGADYFSDVKAGATNGGAAPNGKIFIEVTFYYTYELGEGCYLQLVNVYLNSALRVYAGGGGSGHGLNGAGSVTAGATQTLSASRTGTDGTKEEITYEGKFTVHIEPIDVLVNAKINEYDDGNVLLAAATVTADYEADKTLKTVSGCAYVIAEETYRKEDGSTYVKRALINKAQYASHTFNFPAGGGLVRPLKTSIEF
jgi:hypothetical protein